MKRRTSTCRACSCARSTSVPRVGGLEPFLQLVIDVVERCHFDAVRDAILLRVAAGVDQTALRRCVAERETEVDAGACRRLDLGDDVMAIDRDDRLARRDLDVIAEGAGEVVERVVERTKRRFRAAEHRLDVLVSLFEIELRIAVREIVARVGALRCQGETGMGIVVLSFHSEMVYRPPCSSIVSMPRRTYVSTIVSSSS